MKGPAVTIASLRDVHRARPFRPFILRLADGRSIRVDHPELMAFLGAGRTIAVSYPESDHFELIDLLLVNSVEVGRPRRGDQGRRRSA
jgi:hypothetical protein